jgi:hypothetical protein
MARIWKRCEGSGPSLSQRGKEERSRSLARLGVTDFLKGTPTPVFFVRVTNKGVSHVGDENRVQARRAGKQRYEEEAAGEKRALRLESIGYGSMD